MTVLITGGCGFVGINLAEALLTLGKAVVLLDRRNLPAAASAAMHSHANGLTVMHGDARDKAALESAMRKFDVTHVIHAAVITSGPTRESTEPGEIIGVNLCGMVDVLEAARAAGCRRVVYVSSGSAYGRTLDEAGPLHEEVSPSRPETLYGITKYAAEQTALRLRALWGFDVICARLGSVFGPWEYATGARDRLSPQLQIAALAVAGKTALLPAKEVRRDWIYSRDVADGLIELLFTQRAGHAIYHLSAGHDWTGLFSRWCETLRAAYPRFAWRPAASHDQPNVNYQADRDRAQMDVGRLKSDVGFVPRYGSAQACDDYLAWIQAHEAFIASGEHHAATTP